MRNYRYLLSSILFILNFSANAQDTSATVNRYSFFISTHLAVPYKGTEHVLTPGINFAGTVFYNVSPSVKLGIEVSDQINGGKNSFKSFNAVSADFVVKWFPTALFDKVSKKVDEQFLKNFYLELGMGHNFSHLAADGISSIKTGIGYKVPLKNGNLIDLKLINRGFILKNNLDGYSNGSMSFIGISIGYGF